MTRKYDDYRPAAERWFPSPPAHWHDAPFWTMFTRTTRKGFEHETLLSVYRDHGVVPKDSRDDNYNRASEDLSTYQLVEPGDLVINKMKAWQGSLSISRYRGIVSPAYFVYRPHHDADDRFLHHLLRSQPMIGAYIGLSKGVRIGQWDLEPQNFSRLKVAMPPVAEQCAIADHIEHEVSTIDRMIMEQAGLVEVLRERRIALISRAVTKGLDRSVGLKQSRADWLGEVPEHWHVKRLKFSVASTQAGVWGSEPTGDDDDVLCVRVADFDRPRLRVANEVPTVRSVKESDRLPRLLQPGDLLLEKSGGTAINPVGFVGIFEGAERDAVSSNFLSRVRLAPDQHPRYWLYAHAASYATRLTARSVNQTTGIQNLDQANYFNEVFPFPPPEEQSAIADYLDEQVAKIDALVAEAEGIVAVAKERRSALITAAVTGQIDVRGEVA